MSHRVIQWATGNVGKYALRAIIGHHDLELAGVFTHNTEKHGVDAGEMSLLGTAMHAIHAVRHVCEAEPGIRTFLDLPLITAAGAMRQVN